MRTNVTVAVRQVYDPVAFKDIEVGSFVVPHAATQAVGIKIGADCIYFFRLSNGTAPKGSGICHNVTPDTPYIVPMSVDITVTR